MFRRFFIFLFIILLAGTMGVLSRMFPDHLPEFIFLYAGDTLWAFAAYFLIRFFLPVSSATGVALIAYMVSVLVEISQLARFSWLEDVRHTMAGGLMLGYGFKWSDIFCYLAGVILAALIDNFVLRTQIKET